MPGEKILVGYVADRRGADAVALGVSAAAGGGGLLVGHVRPPAWPARGPGSVDAEWESYLQDRALRALEEGVELAAARGVTAGALPPVEDRGSGKGLAALAAGVETAVIVIGSAPGGSRTGISLGSTADQLLHGSHLPVLIAPKGYADRDRTGFDRVTAAYVRRPGAMAAVEAAAAIAVRHGVPLRLLTFAVGPSAGGRAAALAEEQLHRLVEALESDLADAANAVRETVRGSLRGRDVLTAVATGWDAAHAVSGADWTQGELLVCSSSEAGPLRRVFMGDMSLKIVRSAPCPVMVVPRRGKADVR
ncbi:universal stress protein [Actinocorallia libanotica]|uniref:Universal stress protein n=1 Tax=Actinocorallia libanotica TaxID=46162 RepID=A0ABN1PZR5_9ACTN